MEMHEMLIVSLTQNHVYKQFTHYIAIYLCLNYHVTIHFVIIHLKCVTLYVKVDITYKKCYIVC